MDLNEIRKNAPEGATHYDKFGNYYKVKAINYQWQNGWIMMTHSIMYPVHEIKPLN